MITLRSGDLRLDLLPEVGGRIHALSFEGIDVLRTPDDPSMHERDPINWGSYPMVPWCNRIPGGDLVFDGTNRPQPLNFPGHAIHGRALEAPWVCVDEGVLEYADDGDDAFPWAYLARQEFGVRDDGITLTLSVRNRSDARMPAGIGIHPWFAPAHALEVSLPADRVYPSAGNIPTGDSVPVDGDADLRSLRRPAWDLDECWTGLTGSSIRLRRTDVELDLAYEYSSAADHIVLANLERFDAIAIEPQTHVPDGHARRERGAEGGIDVLEPGETLTIVYGIRRV